MLPDKGVYPIVGLVLAMALKSLLWPPTVAARAQEQCGWDISVGRM